MYKISTTTKCVATGVLLVVVVVGLALANPAPESDVSITNDESAAGETMLAGPTTVKPTDKTTVAPDPKPTPAPEPTPADCKRTKTKPNAAVQSLVVDNHCMVAKFSLYADLGNGEYIDLGTASVNQKDSACKPDSTPVSMMADYKCASLKFTVEKDTDGKVLVSKLTGTVLDKTDTQQKSLPVNAANLFNTTNDKYYKCDAEQTVPMDSDDTKSTAKLVFSKLQYETFRKKNADDSFEKQANVCEADMQSSSSWTVAIVIGLIVLVAVALVTYFAMRR